MQPLSRLLLGKERCFMKTKADVVKGWLRKADSDFAAIKFCIDHQDAFDVGCFHAQQAGENY